jgi:hypothetical protein
MTASASPWSTSPHSGFRNVDARIHCDDSSATEVQQVEAALRRAVDAHPNRPTLEVRDLSGYLIIFSESAG